MILDNKINMYQCYTRHMPGGEPERPPLNGEYRDEYTGCHRIGQVQHHNTVRTYWTVAYIKWRLEKKNCTETRFGWVETFSKDYADRLSKWLLQPENIRAFPEAPSLPMNETECAQNDAGLQREAERRLQEKRQNKAHQAVMCMFPSLRDESYLETPEVLAHTVDMARLFRLS